MKTMVSMILCLLIFSAKPNTGQNTVQSLCAKTIDPGFCLRVLAASPTQSPDDLLKAAVSQAAANAVATADKIKSLLNQPNDPANLVAYFQCSNYYSAAVAALNAASQLLGSRPAADVRSDVGSAASTVQSDGDRCEASFGNGAEAKHALSSENRRLKIHGNIISVVCDAI